MAIPLHERAAACGLKIRNERFADILPERRDALIDDLLIIKRNLLACRSRAPRQTFHHANH